METLDLFSDSESDHYERVASRDALNGGAKGGQKHKRINSKSQPSKQKLTARRRSVSAINDDPTLSKTKRNTRKTATKKKEPQKQANPLANDNRKATKLKQISQEETDSAVMPNADFFLFQSYDKSCSQCRKNKLNCSRAIPVCIGCLKTNSICTYPQKKLVGSDKREFSKMTHAKLKEYLCDVLTEILHMNNYKDFVSDFLSHRGVFDFVSMLEFFKVINVSRVHSTACDTCGTSASSNAAKSCSRKSPSCGACERKKILCDYSSKQDLLSYKVQFLLPRNIATHETLCHLTKDALNFLTCLKNLLGEYLHNTKNHKSIGYVYQQESFEEDFNELFYSKIFLTTTSLPSSQCLIKQKSVESGKRQSEKNSAKLKGKELGSGDYNAEVIKKHSAENSDIDPKGLKMRKLGNHEGSFDSTFDANGNQAETTQNLEPDTIDRQKQLIFSAADSISLSKRIYSSTIDRDPKQFFTLDDDEWQYELKLILVTDFAEHWFCKLPDLFGDVGVSQKFLTEVLKQCQSSAGRAVETRRGQERRAHHAATFCYLDFDVLKNFIMSKENYFNVFVDDAKKLSMNSSLDLRCLIFYPLICIILSNDFNHLFFINKFFDKQRSKFLVFKKRIFEIFEGLTRRMQINSRTEFAQIFSWKTESAQPCRNVKRKAERLVLEKLFQKVEWNKLYYLQSMVLCLQYKLFNSTDFGHLKHVFDDSKSIVDKNLSSFECFHLLSDISSYAKQQNYFSRKESKDDNKLKTFCDLLEAAKLNTWVEIEKLDFLVCYFLSKPYFISFDMQRFTVGANIIGGPGVSRVVVNDGPLTYAKLIKAISESKILSAVYQDNNSDNIVAAITNFDETLSEIAAIKMEEFHQILSNMGLRDVDSPSDDGVGANSLQKLKVTKIEYQLPIIMFELLAIFSYKCEMLLRCLKVRKLKKLSKSLIWTLTDLVKIIFKFCDLFASLLPVKKTGSASTGLQKLTKKNIQAGILLSYLESTLRVLNTYKIFSHFVEFFLKVDPHHFFILSTDNLSEFSPETAKHRSVLLASRLNSSKSKQGAETDYELLKKALRKKFLKKAKSSDKIRLALTDFASSCQTLFAAIETLVNERAILLLINHRDASILQNLMMLFSELGNLSL